MQEKNEMSGASQAAFVLSNLRHRTTTVWRLPAASLQTRGGMQGTDLAEGICVPINLVLVD